jgi:hypothetical protein
MFSSMDKKQALIATNSILNISKLPENFNLKNSNVIIWRKKTGYQTKKIADNLIN